MKPTSKDNYITAIRTMLPNVTDRNIKLMYIIKLQSAIRVNDDAKIVSLFNDLTNLLKHDTDIEPTYKSPPTFEQATIDFINFFNRNVASLPDVTPVYTEYLEKNKPDVPENDSDDKNKPVEKPSDKPESKDKRKKTEKKLKNIEPFLKAGVVLCEAPTQSGKGNFTIACSMKSMINGRTPLVIVRNFTADGNKMENDIKNVNKLFNKFMQRNNVNMKFEITCLRCEKLDSEKFHKSLRGEYPKIVVCLANSIQLNKLYDAVSTVKNSVYDLYIDEVDFIDCGDSNLSDNLNNLKRRAFQTYGITATPLDFILSEKELKTANTLMIAPRKDYRGHHDFIVHTLDIHPEVVALNTKATYEEILESDKNLKPYLEEFIVSKLSYAQALDRYHPNICLIKNTILNENQDALFNGIIKDYGDKLAVVVFNGKGIAMYFDGMKSVKIDNKVVKPKKYYDLEIPDVIQFFKSDEERFKRIVIISGLTTGRCVSLVSRDYEWHLTDMYYVPAASTPVPELIQSTGRLCGRNHNKSHLILNCTLKVARALYDGLNFTNEVLYRAYDTTPKDSDEILKDSIMKVPMERQKLPVGRSLTTKVKVNKRDFNIVKENDGGYNYGEDYKFKRVIREIKETVERKTVEEVDGGSIDEVGIEEYNRLTKKMFPKWSVSDSKISNFMKNLDPHKEYTEKEFRDLCKEYDIKSLGQLKSIKIGTNGFGTIIKQEKNKFFLYPCLKNEFIKFF